MTCFIYVTDNSEKSDLLTNLTESAFPFFVDEQLYFY